jgi:hypothetical protein
LDTPVTGPTAWRRADVETDRQWIYQLTASDIDGLETAAGAVLERGLSPMDFEQKDFPLPNLTDRLGPLIDRVENGRGFILIRGLPIDCYDRPLIETIYWGLGCHFGLPISQNAKGQRLAEVKDRGHDYTETNARGYTTRAKLLPHVDTSDMTALLCMNPAKSGGLSSVVSSAAIFNEILARHPEYLDTLFRGFHHDLRGEGVTGHIDEVTNHRIPVFSHFDGRLSCSFNYKITESAAEKMGSPLTGKERAALEFILDMAEHPDFRFDMALQRGDIQLINNYTLLHYRSAYVDHDDPALQRNMLRLWVNFHDGRPLEPAFADRYNTGARGGVAVGQGNGYAI